MRWLSLLLNPEGAAAEVAKFASAPEPVLSPEVVQRLSQYLRFDHAEYSEEALRCGDGAADALDALIHAAEHQDSRPYRYPLRTLATPEVATAALAEFADCRRPGLIVLLVDHALQVHAQGSSGSHPVWVISLVANSLSVLAAMQTDAPSAVVLSDIIVAKATRARVPLYALALKMFRNEFLVPLLAVPDAASATLPSGPAWRESLDAVTSLNHWHGYDAVLHFAAHAARTAATELAGAGGSAGRGAAGAAAAAGAPDTSVGRVAAVLDAVLGWWRQPKARSVLAAVPEGELWLAYVARAAGDAQWRDHSPAHLLHLVAAGELAPLEPLELRPADVVVFPHALRLTLARCGCLGESARAAAPGALPNILRTAPSCPRLRAFLGTQEGRRAYLRYFDGFHGVGGLARRLAARAALALSAAAASARSTLAGAHPGAAADAAAADTAPGRPHTVLDWLYTSDPQTVLWTSAAAVLAVLRVVFRLSSALPIAPSAAASGAPAGGAPQPSPAIAEVHEPTGTGSSGCSAAARRGAEVQPVAQRRRKAARRGARGALRAASSDGGQPPARETAAGTVCAAGAGAAATAGRSAGVFDPIALRFRPVAWEPLPGPGSPLGAAAAAPLHLRAPPQSRRAPHNPAVSRAIAGVLPRMLQPCGGGGGAAAGGACLGSARQAAAIAQLRVMQALQQRRAKDASPPMLVPLPSGTPADAGGGGVESAPAAGVGGGAGGVSAAAAALLEAQALATSGALDVRSEDCCSGHTGEDGVSRSHSAATTDAAAASTQQRHAQPPPPPPGLAGAAQLRAFQRDECGEIPELFLCPISRELMLSPVLAGDGHIYERTHIESWLRSHRTSPMTNAAMPSGELLPVQPLRSEIQAFKQRYPELR